MKITITGWALQSYLNLKHSNTFTDQEYWSILRPDVEKLRTFPNDPSFLNPKHWGPATDRGGNSVPDGFKMKWRNIGSGQVQLRLMVVIMHNAAFLCQAFVKGSPQKDKRECAKLKSHIRDIKQGRYHIAGSI